MLVTNSPKHNVGHVANGAVESLPPRHYLGAHAVPPEWNREERVSAQLNAQKNMVLLRHQNWGQQINFLLLQPKNLRQQPKRIVDRTKHFVVTKYFCYPYFNK